MVDGAGFGVEKACLNRIRESRLKSETRSNLIHILSRCYEDPKASRIFSLEPPLPTTTRPEGSSGEGEVVSDGVAMKVDVMEDVLNEETKVDEKPMEFSVDELENTLMDIDFDVDVDVDVDVMKGLLEGNAIDQEAVKEVKDSLLETMGIGNGVAESGTNENCFSNVVEVGFAEGEAVRCGNGDANCLTSLGVQLDGPGNVLECGDVRRTNESGDVEEGSGGVKSTSEAKPNVSIASVPNDGFGRPVDSRSQVFYGDIVGRATPPPPGSLTTNADLIKKKKRGGSKEKKKIQKRKKRAEMDKKLGVKRMKLPPPLKPKVVKVCEHYLKGRCMKGEECPFSHDATPLTKSKACIHFARNNCMKGDACPYDHELWKYPCDNYASKGFCSRGSSCLFSHEIPAKEVPGTSTGEKVRFHSTPVPESVSKGLVNSAAKLSVNTPMQVPRGLTFLSFGKSSSDQLTMPDPSRLPQKDDLAGSNHSNRQWPGVVKTLDVTAIPFATPVRSNNVPYLESESDHSSIKKNFAPKAFSSEKRVAITNPLDQALQGLNSLVSCKVAVNRFSNEWHPGLSTKEHNPPVSRLSGLNLHQSLGLSADKKKPGCEVIDPKGKTSKSNSPVVPHMCEGATPAKESGVYCFSSKTSTVNPGPKLTTTIPKDQKSDKIFSIQERGRQSVYVNPFAISAQELKSSASVVSPSSHSMAVNKTVPPSQDMAVSRTMSPSSQGMAVNQATPSVQEAILSAPTLASKFVSGANGSSLGSAASSQLQTKPEIASGSKISSNFRPVKASAILDFIFGTGSKKSIR